MTLLYFRDQFADHDTGQHPESVARMHSILEMLAETGLPDSCVCPDWGPAAPSQVSLTHGVSYIDQIREFAQQGGGPIEADTVMSQDSYDVALLGSGAVIDAVDQVVKGNDSNALCLVRPPGHHALKMRPMGFCLFNHVAVAANFAVQQLNLDRVLIIDWDVHHGNGTQDLFWRDEQIGFFSSHRFPFYPGSGAEDETGAGAGLGKTRNLPVRFGIERKTFLDRFSDTVGEFADHCKPDLIILSAGFDAHRRDPIGSLGLETEDFGTLTRFVQQVADTHCDGRLVSALEGGYDLQALRDSVEIHLRTLLPNSKPD